MKKFVFLALAAMMLLSACGKEALPIQTVTFTLESNPTTGFSWQVEQSGELFEVDTEYVPDETEEPLDGVGGVETIILTPVKAGKTEVTLTYARPWEGGEQGDRLVYTFEVDRNLQVKMTNAYGTSTAEPLITPMPEIG